MLTSKLLSSPGSWISDTYLFKLRCKALITLLNIAEYMYILDHNNGKSIFSVAKNLAWTQQQWTQSNRQ